MIHQDALLKVAELWLAEQSTQGKAREERFLQSGHWVTAEDSFQPFQDQWEEYIVFSPKENKVTLTFPGRLNPIFLTGPRGLHLLTLH